MNLHQKVLSLAVASAYTLAAGVASAQTVVKIGHVGPLTGGIAHLGKDNELGAKLAIEDLNAKGIKLGGQTVLNDCREGLKRLQRKRGQIRK
jgi:branched-chain amino acid transport system substrate-binding protein